MFSRHLIQLADEKSIGLGTPRTAVAASAVYAAHRLTDEKWLTQRQVVDAGSMIANMSTSRIGAYSRELVNAYMERYSTEDPSAIFNTDRFRLG